MTQELPYIIDDQGEKRFLGNVPGPIRMKWPVYGDTADTPLIPEADWKGLIDQLPGGPGPDWPYLSPTHDQDGIGMCNASATVSAMESQRMKQGLPFVALSGGDLYQRIAVGGGDNGSLLEDGLAESMRTGVASVAVTPYLDWRGENPGAAEDRKNYKVLEAFLCPTFAHCMSAVLKGFDLISGIMWGGNFTPDRDGWLPGRARGGGGHAVHGYKPTYRGSQYGIWHKNSWTARWGLTWNGIGGLCVFPREVYAGPVGGWWAVRSVTDTDPFPPYSE